MRHRQLKPIFNQILPSLPGFVGHKSLLIKAPIGGLLRAIDFDPSGWDKDAFYLSVFIMPMCVPKDYLALTFGHRILRLGEHEDWAITRPNLASELLHDIQTHALPFLARAHSYRAAIDVIAKYSANVHARIAMAFLYARVGETDQAIRLIDAYLPSFDHEIAWQKERFDVSVYLKTLLIEDPEAAHRQLLAWEDETLKNIELEQFS